MDMEIKLKYTSKGPNSVGNKDSRRISVRQRMLHPSMVGVLDIASNSSSSPGRSGALSPYCDMQSLYFDDSLYENEMHYHIAQILDQLEDDPDAEELRIVCDSAEEYNKVLDALYRAGKDKFKFYGVSSAPMDIIVEEDPRTKYRQFDEENLLMKEGDNT